MDGWMDGMKGEMRGNKGEREEVSRKKGGNLWIKKDLKHTNQLHC